MKKRKEHPKEDDEADVKRNAENDNLSGSKLEALDNFFKSLFGGNPPNQVTKAIGDYLHHVPEATSTGQMLLGLKGKGPVVQSFDRVSRDYNMMYQFSTLACAVARKLLHGRGNVIEDVAATKGKSAAGVSLIRGTSGRAKFSAPSQALLAKLSQTEINVLQAIKMKAGNCGEFTDLAYCYLNSLPHKNIGIFRATNSKMDHAFVFIAIPKGSGKYDFLICDPWLNFVGNFKETGAVAAYMNPAVYELARDLFQHGISQNQDGEIVQPQLKDDVLSLPPVAELTGQIIKADDTTSEEILTQQFQQTVVQLLQSRDQNKPLPKLWYTMQGQNFPTGDNAAIPDVDIPAWTPKNK